MNTIESLFKDGVMEMATYSPIEPPDQIALRLGIPESQIIKLDANEKVFAVTKAIPSLLLKQPDAR